MTRGFFMVCGVALLAGCPLDPKNIGDPGQESGESGMASDESTVDPPSTGPAETTQANESTGEPPGETTSGGPTEGGSETTSAGESGPTSEGSSEDSTGDLPPPVECFSDDPSVSAAFTLELPDWPHGDETMFDYDVQCDIDEVNVIGGEVETVLSCDLSLVAILRIPVAPEGEVTWAVDDLVRLVIENEFDPGLSIVHAVQMRGLDDDELLVSAVDSSLDNGYESRFPPLLVEQQFPCGVPEGLVRTRLDFVGSEPEVLEVYHAHRGWLAMTADEGYAIDVEKALAEQFHFGAEIKILARRVRMP